jgi:DNA modification methylase
MMIEALDYAEGQGWALWNGDCIDVMGQLPDSSVGYSVFSPPFASLYTYSNSDRDLGNCKDGDAFIEHFSFVLDQLYRVLKPGRLLSMHCMDMPTSKTRDGVIGARDFPGELIRAAQSSGFIFHSRVCIWKDPVTAMQRTKALGLLYKQIKKDSCMSRQGFADYVVTLRKPGENPEPVTHTPEGFPVGLWQKYASPVWMDIDPSDTLQYRAARDADDERHICPLQLGVIRRCIELWSNPGDVVLSPFAGIGSEVYTAAQMGRRGAGIELKPSYFRQAVKNLQDVHTDMGGLFVEVAA